MNPRIKNAINGLANRFGYRVARTRKDGLPLDFSEVEVELVKRVRPFTMTSPEAVRNLRECVRHVVARGIPGAFVECGVWKGGSSMAAALSFLELAERRDIFLFDAYDLPIPPPVGLDTDHEGNRILGGAAEARPYWAAVSAEEVTANMRATGYPVQHVHVVKGLVADVIPARAPDLISILRLDTDTYESTIHNLRHLYPRLREGGFLVLDDYGTHQGVKAAVDEFFAEAGAPPMMHRVDTGSRTIRKCE